MKNPLPAFRSVESVCTSSDVRIDASICQRARRAARSRSGARVQSIVAGGTNGAGR
jgi:hypothetical protein